MLRALLLLLCLLYTVPVGAVQIVWACDVVETQRGSRTVREPAMESIRRGATGTFAAVWVISRADGPAPHVAVGLADVNAAQALAIDADNRCIGAMLSRVADRFDSMTAAERLKLGDKIKTLGIDPKDTDSLQAIFEAAASRTQRNASTVRSLQERLRSNFNLP